MQLTAFDLTFWSVFSPPYLSNGRAYGVVVVVCLSVRRL